LRKSGIGQEVFSMPAYLRMLPALVLMTALTTAQSGPRNTRAAAATLLPDAAQLASLQARFAPTPLRVNTAPLSSGDRQALAKLIEAARIINDVFLDQYWSGARALHQQLQSDTTPLGRARLRFFWTNKGPWDELGEYRSFLPGSPARKLPGANFYPADMSKTEFEQWLKGQPEARPQAESFFTVIRRGSDRRLTAVPYSEAYRADLTRAAALLREAASLTGNASLRQFLNLRADSFLSNNYYASDLAWMDLDAPLDVTIGPYETYNDELFGYKAAFEAYINLRDDVETARLAAFARHLQEIENNLPEDPQYRNPRLGPAAPIRVVNQIFCAGDAAHGVATAAYNLPNDERVLNEKGSKRVMLRNVQQAKYRATLMPIAARVLEPQEQPDLSFEMFFTHILAHELMHGLGPHQMTIAGRKTNPRLELKDAYSAIEEAKADITGLFALQYLMDHAAELNLRDVLPSDEAAQHQLYITYLASSFRTLRFGLNDAHGKGMALQFNYLLDKGAFIEQTDGTFSVNMTKVRSAVRDLTHDLLTIEATGDYNGARRLLDTLGIVRPGVNRALQKLQDIPTDIEPLFITADEVTGRTPAALIAETPAKPAKKTVAAKKKLATKASEEADEKPAVRKTAKKSAEKLPQGKKSKQAIEKLPQSKKSKKSAEKTVVKKTKKG
jgi:hypothetical protein